MTHTHSGGLKRPSWPILRRRLALVRCMLRGPASREALLEAGRIALGEEAWGTAPESALRHDLYALKQEFSCIIRFRAATGYHLDELGTLYLLDLPDDAFQALAFLITWSDTLPTHVAESIGELLALILTVLPPERRDPPTAVDIQFIAPRSLTTLDRTMIQRVRRALRRQQLVFRYHSKYSDGSDGIEHRVAPYALLVRDGHLYLDADSLWASSPDWQSRRILFRLDRMQPTSVRVLPSVIPPIRLSTSRYMLRYVLSPSVARQRDIAQHFADSTIMYHNDGSATISATVDDLWWAQRVLLRYGEHCRIESPSELINLMRVTIQKLATVYKMSAFVDDGT